MFTTTPAPSFSSSDGTSTPTRLLPARIEALSPFSPHLWICAACKQKNPLANTACTTPTCSGTLTTSTPSPGPNLLDRRGRPVSPVRFPVYWLCSTCCADRLVLEILVGRPSCACGRPALQAVYDQFGDLLLFWRDDDGVRDLSHKGKVAEAARRLWVVGGEAWVDEMPVITMGEEEEEEQEQGKGYREGMEIEVTSSGGVLVDVMA
ncbi:hypothetical protein NKR19_g1966 [Coniochaeta hoffmannii]|uniref:Uncharacterized protein n=1 Tax=Coniochaeta hoffmannii TaxID=91930 RepID=A0AA38VSN0_9PEZI|nr:hypothetical protein NKR19_g1966 [Coniochaeta hoffmannii]